jgi:hypothetical protein
MLHVNAAVNIGICYKDINAYSWEQKHGTQNISIKGSKGILIVYKRQVLKIWENYITELCSQSNQPENLEVIPEKEEDAEKKGRCILQNEVEKTVNMRKKMATGNVLTLLGEDGLVQMTQMIINICDCRMAQGLH